MQQAWSQCVMAVVIVFGAYSRSRRRGQSVWGWLQYSGCIHVVVGVAKVYGGGYSIRGVFTWQETWPECMGVVIVFGAYSRSRRRGQSVWGGYSIRGVFTQQEAWPKCMGVVIVCGAYSRSRRRGQSVWGGYSMRGVFTQQEAWPKCMGVAIIFGAYSRNRRRGQSVWGWLQYAWRIHVVGGVAKVYGGGYSMRGVFTQQEAWPKYMGVVIVFGAYSRNRRRGQSVWGWLQYAWRIHVVGGVAKVYGGGYSMRGVFTQQEAWPECMGVVIVFGAYSRSRRRGQSVWGGYSIRGVFTQQEAWPGCMGVVIVFGAYSRSRRRGQSVWGWLQYAGRIHVVGGVAKVYGGGYSIRGVFTQQEAWPKCMGWLQYSGRIHVVGGVAKVYGVVIVFGAYSRSRRRGQSVWGGYSIRGVFTQQEAWPGCMGGGDVLRVSTRHCRGIASMY